MKSIKVTNTGGPEVLELEEITLDKPGADEVQIEHVSIGLNYLDTCLLYTSPSPRDISGSRMPSSA